MQETMNRRDFIKLASITTGTLLVGAGLFNNVLAYPIFNIQGLFSTKRLNNSLEIPVYGLKVDSSSSVNYDEQVRIIAEAFNLGFKHIVIDGGESQVGEAIIKSNVPREELFLSLHLHADGTETDLKMLLNQSLAQLKTTYLDALILHFPYSSDVDENVVKQKLETWQFMEQLYKDKQVRVIGIGDLSSQYLERIIYECEIKPMLNCIENPYVITPRLLELCSYYRIAICTNAPFVYDPMLLKEKSMLKITEKYNKTPQQVMARWGLQKGFITFISASNIQELRDLSEIYNFKLDQRSIKTISNLRQVKNNPRKR